MMVLLIKVNGIYFISFKGVTTLLTPDWSIMKNPTAWLEAAAQVGSCQASLR